MGPRHREQGITVPMFDKPEGGYDPLLDNLRADTLVFAHRKDYSSESKQVRVGMTLTPQLERVFVRITPPESTGIRAEERPYAFNGVQALAGSEAKAVIRSGRQGRAAEALHSTGYSAVDSLPSCATFFYATR